MILHFHLLILFLQTLGMYLFRYMFLEYGSLAEAKEAVKAMNGYKLDKSHIFAVNLFSDFDKYTTVADEWEPPSPVPYKDPVSYHSWEVCRMEC